MDPMNTFWFLLIGLFAGWLAGIIMKGKGFGLVGNFIVGVTGALLGGFIFSLLGIKLFGTLVTALIGAIVLIWLIDVIKFKK